MRTTVKGSATDSTRKRLGQTYQESSPALEVPLSRVNHIRLNNTSNQVRHVVRATTKHDCLRTKTCSANLSNDGIDDRPDTHGVDGEPGESETGLSVGYAGRVGLDAAEDADQEEGYHDLYWVSLALGVTGFWSIESYPCIACEDWRVSASYARYGKAIHTDRSPAEKWDPEPGQTGTDKRNPRAAECDPVRSISVDPGLFEEITRTVY